jgi:gluconolactonase
MKLASFFTVVAIAISAFAEVPGIERLKPELDELLAREVQVEQLATGFKWSEGPVWLDGAVVFSDVPQNIAFRWQQGDKQAKEFLNPSGSMDKTGQGSNGLALDAEGRLLLCQHGDRCVARCEKDGSFTKLVETYEGKRFNSPNDLCVHKDGSLFFTDPPYGLKDKSKQELDFHGVYRLSPDGKVNLVTKEIQWPNGIALSPDQTTLYIAVSDKDQPRVMAMSLDGSNSRILFDATPLKSADKKGGCDGMKVDQKGNLWTTGPGGVLILKPDGTHLGTVLTGQPTANCGFGDDGSTLYITANMHLMRVKTLTKGTGF